MPHASDADRASLKAAARDLALATHGVGWAVVLAATVVIAIVAPV